MNWACVLIKGKLTPWMSDACIRETEKEASFETSLFFYTVEKSIKEKEICIYSRVVGLLSFD